MICDLLYTPNYYVEVVSSPLEWMFRIMAKYHRLPCWRETVAMQLMLRQPKLSFVL